MTDIVSVVDIMVAQKAMTNQLQWFAHERPLYIALYGVSLGASGKLAPVFSAFINSGMGWEWTLVSVYRC